MIVPKQEFVAANGVKTSLDFGSGYAVCPTLVTLFAFTSEAVDRSAVEPMAALLEAYLKITEGLVVNGKIFPE